MFLKYEVTLQESVEEKSRFSLVHTPKFLFARILSQNTSDLATNITRE